MVLQQPAGRTGASVDKEMKRTHWPASCGACSVLCPAACEEVGGVAVVVGGSQDDRIRFYELRTSVKLWAGE
jgi:anaerobic selenocysteine-containing dehydrogenase